MTAPETPVVVLPARVQQALEFVLQRHHVSVRGVQEVYAVLQQPVPSVGTLTTRRAAANRAARRLLARARAQVRDRVTVLAGDDIYVHGQAVKVLLEPLSGAVLETLRWPWREADDWAVWIGDWPALQLFVSDLGTDLVGATGRRQVPHQADWFHERQWWTTEVFEPLARHEQALAAAALRAWDRATRVDGPGRRLGAPAVAAADAAGARAEADFYAAVAAEDLVAALFAPLDPSGCPWTTATIEAQLVALAEVLATIDHAAGQRAWEHVWRHRARWAAHHVLWAAVPVVLRDGTTWDRDGVIAGVLDLRALRRQQREGTAWHAVRAAQVREQVLRAELTAACANLPEVEAVVRSLVQTPRRSSSLVEAFNSRLRVLQMVHRNVSDGMLGFHALAWNLTGRVDGPRRGASPFARRGIDFAQDGRPWYAVLRDELNAA